MLSLPGVATDSSIEPAEQSEELVSDVCRDIKSLDIAKRNLTLTVTALKRLVMLVTALEQLRTQASCRQYDEAAGLIHAVEELAGHFLELRHVARVADLLERKAGVLGDLRQQLLDDYASLLGGAARQDLPEGWGAAAASCVDALGPSMRREVVTQFCLRILEDYKEIFQPPKEASQLETAERRYAWLKRAVRDYEERHAHTFPSEWRVQCGLCMHFCHVTRQHLVEVLSMTSHMVDPELMVRVLRKSIDFENELARKYPADERPAPAEKSGAASTAGLGLKYPDAMGKARPAAVADDGEDAEFAPRFKGIISECFDAYLGTWVRHEERQLLEEMSRGTAPGADEVIEQGGGDEEDDDGSFEPKLLYKSATTLFASMKGSMTKCAGFSTHNTLFDVFQVFRKAMSQYTDRLEKQLPKVTSAPLEARDVQRVCCVIGTAEYCDETLPQLADSLLQVIDPSFEEKVTFTAEQDGLHQLMNRANETLVLSVGCSLDEAFSKMTRTAWASFSQDVGDHSPYVGDISERLPKQLGPELDACGTPRIVALLRVALYNPFSVLESQRQGFLGDLERAMVEHEQVMRQQLRRGGLDQAWQSWIDTVRTTGRVHVAQGPKEVDPTVTALRERRLALVRLRLAEQNSETWEKHRDFDELCIGHFYGIQRVANSNHTRDMSNASASATARARGHVAEAALSANWPLVSPWVQAQQMGGVLAKYLRVLERGEATGWSGEHPRSSANPTLGQKWCLIPIRFEQAARRFGPAQQMAEDAVAHPQVIGPWDAGAVNLIHCATLSWRTSAHGAARRLCTQGGDGDERKDTFKRQVRRREGRQPAPKSCAGAGANNKSLRALAMNMLLPLAQTRRSMEGVLFDVLIVPADPPDALKTEEHGAAYNDQVQSKGKGHGLGAPRLPAFGGLLEAISLGQQSIGKRNFDRHQEFKQRLATLGYDEQVHIIRFAKVGKCYDRGKRGITLCVGEHRKELIVLYSHLEIAIGRGGNDVGRSDIGEEDFADENFCAIFGITDANEDDFAEEFFPWHPKQERFAREVFFESHGGTKGEGESVAAEVFSRIERVADADEERFDFMFLRKYDPRCRDVGEL
ncbi:unnamed protein product [Prorocentrum cordatum]|uniref:Vps53 N-terminal domain-containing protein n=1 Tax=Prorocentrum cordatum TaxID=2364126 RepID=A0ABN9RBS1_9DINO|nr:unnamed protein product [Polarella glacialis]